MAKALQEDGVVTASSATVAQLTLAHQIHNEIAERFGSPVYARIDLIADVDGSPLLLEFEAIEASLYLWTSPGASQRLADAVRAS